MSSRPIHSGVAGLRLLLRGNPGALTYSHEITAAVDAPPFLILCIVFPLIALGLALLSATFADPARTTLPALRRIDAAVAALAEQADPVWVAGSAWPACLSTD